MIMLRRTMPLGNGAAAMAGACGFGQTMLVTVPAAHEKEDNDGQERRSGEPGQALLPVGHH